jgi:hypothetical protein
MIFVVMKQDSKREWRMIPDESESFLYYFGSHIVGMFMLNKSISPVTLGSW